MDHSHEEIRAAVLDILASREPTTYGATQYEHLQLGVAEVLHRREPAEDKRDIGRHGQPILSTGDRNRFHEVFWALFREGVIIPGCDDANREFPFFRTTGYGQRVLAGTEPYFFHDVSSFAEVIAREVPDIDDVTLLYLKEAMQAFRAECILSSTVMLGVAAEHTFLLLTEAADRSLSWKQRFASVARQRTILQKINKFKHVLDQHLGDLPSKIKEGLDTDFFGIQSLIRVFRNQAGHPTGEIVARERAWILLQLFVPYCKKVYQMINHFSPPAT